MKNAAGKYMPNVYGQKIMNADGSHSTVDEIVAEMQASGTRQILIDRWLQGLEISAN